MKKILLISLILLAILFSRGSALAWHRHYYGYPHFRVFIAPPILLPPPPVIYYRGYYPPPVYYEPYYDPYRVWVPGHWEERQTPHGWERVWVPGYWRYGP